MPVFFFFLCSGDGPHFHSVFLVIFICRRQPPAPPRFLLLFLQFFLSIKICTSSLRHLLLYRFVFFSYFSISYVQIGALGKWMNLYSISKGLPSLFLLGLFLFVGKCSTMEAKFPMFLFSNPPSYGLDINMD